MKRKIFTILLSCLFFVLAVSLVISSRRGLHVRTAGEEREERSGARGALDFWAQARAYPGHDIPADKYYRAYQSVHRTLKRLPQPMSAANWEPIGPVNLNGRSLSVAVNPQNSNTVLLGTASGGLWRTHTSGLGADWNQITLGYPALGISAIVYDPLDSNTIYIGTGEVYAQQHSSGGLVIRTTRGSYGIGILKTADGGATWTKSLDWTYEQQRGVQKITMNPLNHNTLYASTTEGIYKTMDAGLSWNRIDPYVLPFISHDVIVHAVDTNKVMVSYGNLSNPPILIDRSTDGGASWLGFSGGVTARSGKCLLGMSASNPDIVYATVPDSIPDDPGNNESIFKTTNFGDSWTEIPAPGIWGVQGWYSHYVAVSPTDPNRIVFNAVGSSYSTDGGASFTTVGTNYSDNHGYAIDPNNPDIFYAANDDGIYRSTDFGISYASVGLGLQTGQLYKGFAVSTTDSSLALVQSQDHIPGYIYHGGLSWEFSARDEAGWTAIDPTNDNIMYAIDRFGGGFYKSTDRGITFAFQTYFGGIGSWNSPFVISPTDPTTMYFGDKRVFRSVSGFGSCCWILTNGGAQIDGGNPALSMAIHPTNPDVVYVGMAPLVQRAHIFFTPNGGSNWFDATGTLPDRYPMDIAIDPSNPLNVYVAFGGFGTGHLFKSSDAGTSWTDITGTLPDIPTTSVKVDPFNPNVLYVGNDFGVNVSTDGGSSWSSFSEGLPDAVIVSDLTISPSDHTLRLGTHGNGAYRRKLVGVLPPSYVDCAPHALISPQSGSILTVDSTVAHLSASFRTLSAQAGVDSIDVKYRVLQEGAQVFNAAKHIPALMIGETRQVTFADGYTFTLPGTYTLEAIVLTPDQDPSNDTLRGELVVVPPPSLASYEVEKINCPYIELLGGTSGPSGDDAQVSAPLPFAFVYDGNLYDQVQISTNGWIELGAGTVGSFHGLSSASQLFGYFCYCPFGSTRRPTKTLDPWWTDLGTTDNSPASAITYGVEGSSPHRVFVAQWKNVLAYYAEGQTTTRLNFQVRLYEETNVIEFHYGPVVAGTLNAYLGANVGFKDALGGDNRFFDLARFAAGAVADIAYLSPYEWPGQDSCFRMTPTVNPSFTPYGADWNLASIPLIPNDGRKQTLFPGLPVFRYSGNYQSVSPAESLKTGEGYWVRFPNATAHAFTGSEFSSATIAVRSGWNMVGSIDHSVPAPVDPNLGIFLGYSPGGGYFPASTITPGQGYWVYAINNGSYPLGPDGQSKRSAEQLETCSKITITDQRGRCQSLYLTDDEATTIDRYRMPPLPPVESFDARFTSGRMLELIPSNIEKRYTIVMQSPHYPLTISYSVKTNQGRVLIFEETGKGTDAIPRTLSGEGRFSVDRGNGNTLSIRTSTTTGLSLPTAFMLQQNYPNPFNPGTAIGYSLPVAAHVNLRVYNTLGQAVAILVDQEQGAGHYSVNWNALDFPSGIYYCRFLAGSFTDTKKMLFIR